ncbi:MAG: S24 family peptidase [Verrucomicrobium sp.]
MPVLQRSLRLSDRQLQCLQSLADQRSDAEEEIDAGGDAVADGSSPLLPNEKDMLAVRAQAILLMAQGREQREICRQLKLGHSELARVRRRFMILGLSGLHDVSALSPRRSSGLAGTGLGVADDRTAIASRVKLTPSPPSSMPHTRTDSKSAASAADRFRTLREKLRLSRPQLAQWLGVTRQYITKIEGGMPPSKPVMLLVERMEHEALLQPELGKTPPRELESVSRGFALADVPASTLSAFQSASKTRRMALPPKARGNKETGTAVPAPSLAVPALAVRSLPLLAMHEAASLTDPRATAGVGQQELSFVVEDEQAFAVRIGGEAMAPHYPEGSIAIVCPNMPSRNGDLVLVRLKDERGGGALLRIVHFTTPEDGLVLTSTHSAYPSLTVKSDDLLWQAPVAVSLRHLR